MTAIILAAIALEVLSIAAACSFYYRRGRRDGVISIRLRRRP